jgi:hypothetical protein
MARGNEGLKEGEIMRGDAGSTAEPFKIEVVAKNIMQCEG